MADTEAIGEISRGTDQPRSRVRKIEEHRSWKVRAAELAAVALAYISGHNEPAIATSIHDAVTSGATSISDTVIEARHAIDVKAVPLTTEQEEAERDLKDPNQPKSDWKVKDTLEIKSAGGLAMRTTKSTRTDGNILGRLPVNTPINNAVTGLKGQDYDDSNNKEPVPFWITFKDPNSGRPVFVADRYIEPISQPANPEP